MSHDRTFIAYAERVLLWSDPQFPVPRIPFFEILNAATTYDVSCVVLAGHISQPGRDRYANVFLAELGRFMDIVPGGGRVELLPSFSLPHLSEEVQELMEGNIIRVRSDGKLYEVANDHFRAEWVFLSKPTRRQVEQELSEGRQVVYVGHLNAPVVGALEATPGLYLFQAGMNPVAVLPDIDLKTHTAVMERIETLPMIEATRKAAAYMAQFPRVWGSLRGVAP